MASTAPQNQNRCVFVGNIPYDATEEQLIRICEEVGPVVSFRLVLDKETGKPKGYGFCEYKDEETALSARRNLQGYEINGRQLRVDFAENGKNADRNRDQGRGGPGVGPNLATAQNPSGTIPSDLAASQPLGLSSALSAMSAMVGALGGTQSGLTQQGPDPLTNYLARMSRNQLLSIVSEIKLLAAQNNNMVRQLLQRNPVLLRALFQAEIMLGLVTPHMMQMTSSQQHPSHLAQSQIHQQPVAGVSVQPRPPPANPILLAPRNPIPVVQVPVPVHVPITTAGGPSMLQPLQTHPNVAASGGLVPQLQSTVLQQNSRPPFGLASLAHQPAPPVPSITMPENHLRQPASQIVPPNGQQLNVRSETAQSEVKPWSEMTRPSKMRRLDATNNMSVSAVNAQLAQAGQTQMATSTGVQPGKLTQQLSAEAQSALLQQVLNLTPEQLSSLPIEEQQQVLQLQKALSSGR
ncbi:Cleavage stimulation factor 64 kDa subunit [Rhynchospora pubera]|uniref:Cleavage stimulation factor 64 kDa subunit n=1 Tax=Rhynchospora pubera TaxID=906938 RepID=A0AAV8HR19_9POAL|nr:Cleavage stimulation factor 64 kDa subunit [Rhynchospora pubera]